MQISGFFFFFFGDKRGGEHLSDTDLLKMSIDVENKYRLLSKKR